MEIQKISNADWLDLLFDGRNKEYGAYDLRKNYNRRLIKALTIMASICLLLAAGCTMVGKLRGKDSIKQPDKGDVFLTEVALPEPPVEIPPPPMQKPLAAAAPVATIR